MKNLIKKTVLLIGTVCLCFLGMVFYGPYREAQAASYSVSTFAQLKEACEKSGTHTVTVTSNIDITDDITIRGNITINGNGKKLTQKWEGECFVVERRGKLTVSNLTVTREEFPNANVFMVKQDGVLIVNSGSYVSGNASGEGTTIIDGAGMVTINGGDFYGVRKDHYAVQFIGSYDYVINDGNFYSSRSGVGLNFEPNTDASAVQTLTVNDGNFYGNGNNGITVGAPDGTQVGSSVLTVNGGNFYENGLNGISVISANQTCNIKRANIYGNGGTGILVTTGKLNFISAAADAPYLKVYNNGAVGVTQSSGGHNIGVQQGGTFTGGNATIYNSGNLLDKGNGIRINNGTVTVNEGLSIKDCENGIVSYNSTDKVTVNGGLISGCKTGINMDSSGTCTINNANVTANVVGIDADYGSTLKVVKGTITNNTTGIWCEARSKTTLAGSSAGAIVIAGNSENGIKTAHSATFSGAHLALLAP